MGNNFVNLNRNIKTDNNSELLTKRLFNLQPKNNYLRSSSKKAEIFPGYLEIDTIRRIANGCSSEKERKVNALALRADEGRDYLR